MELALQSILFSGHVRTCRKGETNLLACLIVEADGLEGDGEESRLGSHCRGTTRGGGLRKVVADDDRRAPVVL